MQLFVGGGERGKAFSAGLVLKGVEELKLALAIFH